MVDRGIGITEEGARDPGSLVNADGLVVDVRLVRSFLVECVGVRDRRMLGIAPVLHSCYFGRWGLLA